MLIEAKGGSIVNKWSEFVGGVGFAFLIASATLISACDLEQSGVTKTPAPAATSKKTVATSTSYVIREYPEEQADGSIVLVTQLSDGRYTTKLVKPAPTPTPKPPDLEAALATMKEAAKFLNEGMGVRLFLELSIKEEVWDCRLVMTVSDAWYLLASYEKERLIETFADIYAQTCVKYGLCVPGGYPELTYYPTTSFVDSFGKEVAYKSTWNTKVLR